MGPEPDGRARSKDGLEPARLSHDGRILLLVLAAGLPGVVVSLVLLWSGEFTAKVQWTLGLLVVSAWLGFAAAARERVVTPLQTLSNMLAALREGDYSIRARGATPGEALGQVLLEANALGDTLHGQRLGALEATNLLRTVMAEIDVAVFTFDDRSELTLVNRAGERLLLQPESRLLGRHAASLGLEDCLTGPAVRTLQTAFPGKTGRWGLRRGGFREDGRPHLILVLSDLSEALREEERLAWRRLIRVIGHELGNSLAPIKSMAGTLVTLLESARGQDWQSDMKRGLDVIGERADALSRFMSAYARLARLPPPTFSAVDVDALVRRVAALESSYPVAVARGPREVIAADPDQIEQLLINLIRNAVDAVAPTGGKVSLRWESLTEHVRLVVEDDGPGLPETANLFVPFFTTKAGGSGIGLVLSRQIAEAHGGSLELVDRIDGSGCRAALLLPKHRAGGLSSHLPNGDTISPS